MSDKKPRVLILFYSTYGHTYRLARAISEGVSEAGGAPVIMQTAELIPENSWNDKIRQAKAEMQGIPIADPRTALQGIDGLIVGSPTRFGNMAAQMRNFWDQTGPDWTKGTLIGKPAAFFTGSESQHGGQETTLVSMIVSFMHHGCVIVGLPYSYREQMTMAEISGGTPYGASDVVGDTQERQRPSENEKTLARALGHHLTTIAAKLMS